MTNTPPYSNIPKEELIVRDHLAVYRTVLANERTLLSYVRTSIGLVASGVGLIELFTAGWTELAGWALLGVTPVVFATGLYRFQRIRRDLAHLR